MKKRFFALSTALILSMCMQSTANAKNIEDSLKTQPVEVDYVQIANTNSTLFKEDIDIECCNFTKEIQQSQTTTDTENTQEDIINYTTEKTVEIVINNGTSDNKAIVNVNGIVYEIENREIFTTSYDGWGINKSNVTCENGVVEQMTSSVSLSKDTQTIWETYYITVNPVVTPIVEDTETEDEIVDDTTDDTDEPAVEDEIVDRDGPIEETEETEEIEEVEDTDDTIQETDDVVDIQQENIIINIDGIDLDAIKYVETYINDNGVEVIKETVHCVPYNTVLTISETVEAQDQISIEVIEDNTDLIKTYIEKDMDIINSISELDFEANSEANITVTEEANTVITETIQCGTIVIGDVSYNAHLHIVETKEIFSETEYGIGTIRTIELVDYENSYVVKDESYGHFEADKAMSCIFREFNYSTLIKLLNL